MARQSNNLMNGESQLIDGLYWVRAKSFYEVPVHLIQKVKGVNIRVDRLYMFDAVAQNPLCLLFLLKDKDNTVKGFLWAMVNPIENVIHGNALSVEPEIYGKGIVNEAVRILTRIKELLGLDKVTWETTRPKAFEKIVGAKRSKRVLMEV